MRDGRQRPGCSLPAPCNRRTPPRFNPLAKSPLGSGNPCSLITVPAGGNRRCRPEIAVPAGSCLARAQASSPPRRVGLGTGRCDSVRRAAEACPGSGGLAGGPRVMVVTVTADAESRPSETPVDVSSVPPSDELPQILPFQSAEKDPFNHWSRDGSVLLLQLTLQAEQLEPQQEPNSNSGVGIAIHKQQRRQRQHRGGRSSRGGQRRGCWWASQRAWWRQRAPAPAAGFKKTCCRQPRLRSEVHTTKAPVLGRAAIPDPAFLSLRLSATMIDGFAYVSSPPASTRQISAPGLRRTKPCSARSA